MKVAELRQKLAKLKKDEITKLAVEFYKLIPKAKKEDNHLDNLIDNPNTKVKKASQKGQGLLEITIDINQFIDYAKAEYYWKANKVVPKKERSKWRFAVKRWYKELNNFNRSDADIVLQTELLKKLYELLCESYNEYYFTADYAFQSISIDQIDFYETIISFFYELEGPSGVINKGFPLLFDHGNHSYDSSLPDYLKKKILPFLNDTKSKQEAITYLLHLIDKHGFTPVKPNSKYNSDNFYRAEKHNNLVKMVFALYMHDGKKQEAVDFFQKQYSQSDLEIKLYVQVSLLVYPYQEKDLTIQVIETAQAKGITPRKRLLEILKSAKAGKLPKYM